MYEPYEPDILVLQADTTRVEGRHYPYHRTALSTAQIWGWEKGSAEGGIGLWHIRLTTWMVSAPSEAERMLGVRW